MIFSLNEIDVHCKKAVRGAGFEWGYAEEMGKCARWLAKYDLPGVPVLAAYLAYRELHGPLFLAPDRLNSHKLLSDDAALYCPILMGAYLCDRASAGMPASMTIKNLAYPLLLLPYLVFIGRDQQKTISFQFGKNHFLYADQKLKAEVDSSVSGDQTKLVELVLSNELLEGNQSADFEQNIEESDWQVLGRLANRTYVPASDVSRQGAGSEQDRLR